MHDLHGGEGLAQSSDQPQPQAFPTALKSDRSFELGSFAKFGVILVFKYCKIEVCGRWCGLFVGL